MLAECGDFPNAANYLDQACVGRSKLLGEGHAHTLIALIHLAILKARLGDRSGAEETCERLLSNGTKVIAFALESDGDVGHGLSQLGRAVLEARWSDLATKIYREHLAVLKSLPKPNPQHLAECLGNLAALHCAQGDHATARNMYEQAISVSAQFCESNDPNSIMLTKGMGLALEGLGQKEEASNAN